METPSHSVGDSSDADVDVLVVTHVNVPFRKQIDGPTLAAALHVHHSGVWRAHVHAFLTEIPPRLVIAFAQRHGLDATRLLETFRMIMRWSGDENPTLEKALVRLADATPQA